MPDIRTSEAYSPDAERLDRPPPGGLLEGLRVADFCWAGVGALATRVLADFGAEVIKIEDRHRLDLTRRMPIYRNETARAISSEDDQPNPNKSGHFNNYNRDKLGVTINMSLASGRALAEKLIASSGALTENFAPGVMERWGLTDARVLELNPSVIYARMSGFGHDGPDAGYKSYGPIVQAVSGLSFVGGLPGQEPSGWGLSYMDNQASYYNAASILIAHYHRLRTGAGAIIDSSATEIGIGLLGPMLLDYVVNGRPGRRPDFPPGNRLTDQIAAPHGVYRCAGVDRWIAIAVFREEDWINLVTEMGNPEWALEERWSTREGRYASQDDLDKLIENWTIQHDAMDLTDRLQTRGVEAGLVQRAEDLLERDPQITHRRVHFTMDHPVVGPARFESVPIRFSQTEPTHWRSAPLLGEDNDYVFGEILGLSSGEIEALADEGAI